MAFLIYKIQTFVPVLIFFFQLRAVSREVPGLFPPHVWSCGGLQMASECKLGWPVLGLWAISATKTRALSCGPAGHASGSPVSGFYSFVMLSPRDAIVWN